ncbi:MAG: lytic transglycosylase domain-containing protein [Rhodobacteraceae bacterium]|nr:lytic transglycosylase domain-containing protein [Paracoccaceae bacterium]
MTSFRNLWQGLAAAAVICATDPVGAASWSEDGEVFAELLKAGRSGNWEKAGRYAEEISRPEATIVVEWLRLRDGADDWQSYLDFLRQHGDWPGLKILRASGEAAITADADPESVVAYFSDQAPQTGNGAVRLAEAWSRLQRGERSVQAIQDGWKSLPFTDAEQAEALTLYGEELGQLHFTRLDNLLWENRRDEVQQIFPLLDKGTQRLADARMALRNRLNGVDARVRRIPASLLNDPGLAFDRIVWRLVNEREAQALELLHVVSASPDSLGRPDKWASRRLGIAHWLMREGRYGEAYRVASQHHLADSDGLPELTLLSASRRGRAEREQLAKYAELEWLSGYLQYRFLNDDAAAVGHFQTFRSIVTSPISLARAGYWLGLAHDANGAQELAAQAFAFGAGFQTTFYGQLSAEIAGVATDARLTGRRMAEPPESASLQAHPVVRVGLLFHHANHDSHAAWFLAHVAESLDEVERISLAAMAYRHGAEFSTVKVAKEGVKLGHSDIGHLFPLVGIEELDLPVAPEIAMSVARQETEFRDSAVSGKGAVGVMQIKPSTGRELARQIGLSGNINHLLRHRETNLLLGATYLRDRLDEFDGSYILAFASYNAGPARVQSWLPQIGDPRSRSIDAIDWIEHIPYGETRNYVMRVMEAISVYRIRLAGESLPIRISDDLGNG